MASTTMGSCPSQIYYLNFQNNLPNAEKVQNMGDTKTDHQKWHVVWYTRPAATLRCLLESSLLGNQLVETSDYAAVYTASVAI